MVSLILDDNDEFTVLLFLLFLSIARDMLLFPVGNRESTSKN